MAITRTNQRRLERPRAKGALPGPFDCVRKNRLFVWTQTDSKPDDTGGLRGRASGVKIIPTRRRFVL